jgi:hypothetical protein
VERETGLVVLDLANTIVLVNGKAWLLPLL